MSLNVIGINIIQSQCKIILAILYNVSCNTLVYVRKFFIPHLCLTTVLRNFPAIFEKNYRVSAGYKLGKAGNNVLIIFIQSTSVTERQTE